MSSTGQNRLAQKRRKLKKRSWDGVTDDQIFQRDGWQCRLAECLCPDGRDLDQSLRETAGFWAPAIHHIVRLADGGLSNADNKLAAHNRCSSMANREIQRAQAREPVDPAPGVVLVRLIGLPADIDAALAVLASSGNWETATRTAAPKERIAGQEKVLGLLTVRHGDLAGGGLVTDPGSALSDEETAALQYEYAKLIAFGRPEGRARMEEIDRVLAESARARGREAEHRNWQQGAWMLRKAFREARRNTE